MVPSGGFQAPFPAHAVGSVMRTVVAEALSSRDGGGRGSGSSSALRASSAAGEAAADALPATQRPPPAGTGAGTGAAAASTLRPFPDFVFPAYRPMPALLRAGVAAASAFLALASVGARGGAGWPGLLQSPASSPRPVGRLLMRLAFRMAAAAALLTAVAQEALLGPTRIDVRSLLAAEGGWLPSTLSRFERVSGAAIPTLGGVELGPIGVHYLRYDAAPPPPPSSPGRPRRFDALHCSHGFGASSLSWLPSLPALTDRLGARVGLAHDAVGFGFTDRPPARRGRREDLVPYSLAGSAALGTRLLDEALAEEEGGVAEVEEEEEKASASCDEAPTVALLGHSMGCASTLRIALALPTDARRFVVLVSPALFASPTRREEAALAAAREGGVAAAVAATSRPRGALRRAADRALAAAGRAAVGVPAAYVLRRLVGRATFWSDSLRLVWGDPDGVTASDALRFQWPAIGRGWEEGLLAFTRSRVAGVDSFPGGDMELLRSVLDLPNTRVCIVASGNDRVVRPEAVRAIADQFQGRLRYVEIDGRGHDPFEEDIDEFVNVLEEVLKENGDFCSQ